MNSGHDAFPAILAEALDVVSACDSDMREAASTLGCTASQLTKLLREEPRAMARVNQARTAQGLHRLK